VRRVARRGFATGLLAGAGSTLGVGAALAFAIDPARLASWPSAQPVVDWVWQNFGLSLLLFGLVLGLYIATLRRLRHALATAAPVATVAQCDQLLDTWTSLFFGVGVIWTAIGMRGALVFALGEPGAGFDPGARVILERMVDGGILVALSTTIAGGIGGYLLRVAKALTVEAELRDYYDRQAQAPVHAIRVLLTSIDDRLRRHPTAPAVAGEADDAA
jgi:hypothetical protein